MLTRTISPDNSDSDSGSDSGQSDATLEDLESNYAPLQRMQARYLRSGNASPVSDCSSNSSIVYDIDFETLIDDLLAESPCPLNEDRNTVTVAASKDGANDSLMIKCLHQSAPELAILLRLNHSEFRDDPWNPIPHIICAVERDERVFLCMHRLVEFNNPPLQTVVHYIDFFRQVLEGLTFLHEHSIARLSRLDLAGYMVDLGPTTSAATGSSSVESFDRTRYPVRYYFTDLSSAREYDDDEAGGRAADPASFRKDVEDCAGMMESLSSNIPSIAGKVSVLVSAMRTGTFDADAARKLFEALCKALPADIFDEPVPPIPPSPDSDASRSTPPTDAYGPMSSSASMPILNLARKPKPRSTALTPRVTPPPPPGLARTRSLDRVRRALQDELERG
ncbi:hypothetical protein FB45DRAFT_909050 [Roridomyces roridus]|uniref:Protein kinase domain-containing protein n=1 Tax=Roridomyces roridus TaxID=1738132 RepID=A0AAD7BYP4_9AGAR|nr:hypothetical protein FB45DRAFT_909050 [Roridomyces roridus]